MQDPTVHSKEKKARCMPLGVLCAEAGVGCPPAAAHTPVWGVTADSRRVQKGWLFVAIKGMRQDGATFIKDAMTRGCAAVVCEDVSVCTPELPIPVLYVPDGRSAMAYLFDAWYGHPGRGLCLVGVTGTNGKTSVSAMLRHILVSAGIPCGIIGTVGCLSPDGRSLSLPPVDENAHMTTPDPEELYAMLAAMRASVPPAKGVGRPVVVMEVTSHALTLGKVEPLHFHLSVFTNLTPDHLDLHGSMEAYAAAKFALFDQTRVGVINAADAYGRRLLMRDASVEKWLICHPAHRGADLPCRKPCERIYAGQIRLCGADGVAYRLMSPTARVRVTCPVPGSFTVENTLLAASAALELGVRPAVVKDALATFGGVGGRMERVPLPSHIPYAVFIDFAHTPDALEHLLQTVNQFRRAGERVVTVFGCGGDRDPSKRPVMGSIAARGSQRVVITSDNSRTEDPMAIIRAIAAGIPSTCPYEVIPDRAEAIRHVIRTAEAGDIILLVGKGHENYEIDRTGVHPFSERDIVQRAVEGGRYVKQQGGTS